MNISWHSQGKKVCGKCQEGDLPVKFLPLCQTLGKSEDEFVVYEVDARIPPFTQKVGRLDGETSLLKFDSSPVRVHMHFAFVKWIRVSSRLSMAVPFVAI